MVSLGNMEKNKNISLNGKTGLFILLGSIILLGFILRIYHLDFPSIGYHNMKENEYLSIAEEMLRTKDFVNRRVYFYNALEEEERFMEIYPQLPLISYQIILCWNLFGRNLWSPRLMNILFGLGYILIIYLTAKELLRDKRISLFCALLMAILPLSVFFSRNLQPESPALFFMLLGSLLYLKFIFSFKFTYFFLGGLSLSFCWAYKFTFLIALLPFILSFPYRKFFLQRNLKFEFLKTFFIFILSFLPIFLLIFGFKISGQWIFKETISRVNLFEIFNPYYWKRYGRIILWYVWGENFTPIFTITAFLGIIFAFLRRDNLVSKYIRSWTISILPYSMILSDYINQHNYYQMPFLILVCLASSYAIKIVSLYINRFIKKDVFVYAMVILVLLNSSEVIRTINRMFGTVFLGEDIAGDNLKRLTQSDEGIFILTHCQGYGICRYAQRRCGWTDSLEEFKSKEERFNIKYICIYPVDFFEKLKSNRELFEYIRGNYRFYQVGLTIAENNPHFHYFILQKGGNLDFSKITEKFKEIKLAKIYEVLGKKIPFYILDIE